MRRPTPTGGDRSYEPPQVGPRSDSAAGGAPASQHELKILALKSGPGWSITPAMTLPVGHLTPISGPAHVAPVSKVDAPSTKVEAPQTPRKIESADTADIIPSSPPPSVRDEMAAAALKVQEMHSDNRELHFAKDPTSNRIVIQVRDLKGEVIRTIPPSEALDIMSGAKSY